MNVEGRGGRLNVRFFPGTKKHRTSLIAGFLKEFKVEYEMVRVIESRYTHHSGSDPAVEVNGQLFVNPNVDALKKLLLKEEKKAS
jgi:hypothetical protein